MRYGREKWGRGWGRRYDSKIGRRGSKGSGKKDHPARESREIEELPTEEDALEAALEEEATAGSAAGVGCSTRGQSSSEVGEGTQVTAV